MDLHRRRQLIEIVHRQFRLDWQGIHGVQHWARVRLYGLRLAQETGARYGGVLYVDSLTDADGPAPTYLKLLEINADTILKGFSTQP